MAADVLQHAPCHRDHGSGLRPVLAATWSRVPRPHHVPRHCQVPAELRLAPLPCDSLALQGHLAAPAAPLVARAGLRGGLGPPREGVARLLRLRLGTGDSMNLRASMDPPTHHESTDPLNPLPQIEWIHLNPVETQQVKQRIHLNPLVQWIQANPLMHRIHCRTPGGFMESLD